MKQYFVLTATIFIFMVVACHSAKKTNTMDNQNVQANPNMKANLLDGTWEANYVMNSPSIMVI
jgi:uncharacterized protein YcfL